MNFSAKIVNFEKLDYKDQDICDDTLHIHSPQSLVQAIIVAFYKSAKNSEHGDTKLVLSEFNETIPAKTKSKTKLQILQRVEFS